MPTSHAILERRRVGDLEGELFVARYQRGYRWGEHEVRQLLDDLWEYRDKQYSLQPIVVKRREEEWELVDGQQRLTTLYLLLQYMQRAGLKSVGPPYRLRYETRQDSARYLENPETEGFDDNIDFFHIHRAWNTIHAWFSGLPQMQRQLRADKLFGALVENVSVLWYHAPAELDAITLFTRLNVGRIPLTDAELVKALLLTTLPRDVRDLRAAELGATWDRMERDLRHPDVWAFVSRADPASAPTRLSLLLDARADAILRPPKGRRPPFRTFDVLRSSLHEHGHDALWSQIVDIHALVMGWYEDRDIYHKVGFLVASGHSLQDLAAQARDRRRRDFQAALDDAIRRAIDLSSSDAEALSYEHNPEKCARVLLLANVEAVRRLQHSTERYPFRHHRDRGGVRWSLEHIHAQQAEGLTKAEQWQAWLAAHREALAGLRPSNPARRDALIRRIDEEVEGIERITFQDLSREVASFFTDDGDDTAMDDVHGLANLALLPADANSALNNSVFEVKRRRLIALDRQGVPIPICTRRLFLKYYSDAGARQPHIWGPQDREAWLEALLAPGGLIHPYLREQDQP